MFYYPIGVFSMSKESKQNNIVVPAMRERLMVNRTGKMTANQWLDIVIHPIVTMLVLFIPLSVVLMPFMMRAMMRLAIILPILLLFFAAPFIVRAFKYARAPIYFEMLTASSDSSPLRAFWRSVSFHDKSKNELRFGKWLAPRPKLKKEQPYLVYYLKDPKQDIVLSIAPADHPDAGRWQPTSIFESRFRKRTQNLNKKKRSKE
jgi:hypothetical protein